ncbi:MAG: hypothetical protein VX438_14285 [Planctomycetota bacterium]|nr:hypothetical protein [Planctomycetota bacterium]
MNAVKSWSILCVMFFLTTPWFWVGCRNSVERKDIPSKTGKARVGVGKKGEGYGNLVPILKPAATFWKVKEKIAFEIVIPKTLQLFEATHGRKPKSHAEFMKKIIEEGKVKLPQLDEGLEYFYDAQNGELMVRNQVARD